mmetsp:Transcript_39407/g.111609  ORF Transcript_39407/g.111609 Transcript_39407/m.111609 type:complete len:229 (-) Transcript_39407:1773-2459(-)
MWRERVAGGPAAHRRLRHRLGVHVEDVESPLAPGDGKHHAQQLARSGWDDVLCGVPPPIRPAPRAASRAGIVHSVGVPLCEPFAELRAPGRVHAHVARVEPALHEERRRPAVSDRHQHCLLELDNHQVGHATCHVQRVASDVDLLLQLDGQRRRRPRLGRAGHQGEQRTPCGPRVAVVRGHAADAERCRGLDPQGDRPNPSPKAQRQRDVLLVGLQGESAICVPPRAS